MGNSAGYVPLPRHRRSCVGQFCRGPRSELMSTLHIQGHRCYIANLFDVSLTLSISILASNEALRGEESILRVDNGLTLGRYANKALAILCETDH